MLVVGGLALPALLLPDACLLLFLHDPATLALARLPLQLTAATMALEALGMVLMNAHYGAGQSGRVLLISLTMQWCLFLPVALVLQSVWSVGLLTVWTANLVYRLLQAATFVWSWETRGWARVRV